MNDKIEFPQPETAQYEIVLLTRNHKDETTGSRSFKTDSPEKLCEFYQKHNAYRNLKKKRKKKKEKLPTKKEADQIMKKVGEYADKKQENK